MKFNTTYDTMYGNSGRALRKVKVRALQVPYGISEASRKEDEGKKVRGSIGKQLWRKAVYELGEKDDRASY